MPLSGLIRQGDLAVDIFFVLSGFILVYVYGANFRVPDVLFKRFARLYPVHAVTLGLVVAMMYVAQVSGQDIDAEISAHVIAVHSLALHSVGLLDSLSLNYPSWSFSAEACAYLAFPLLVPLVLRGRLRLVIPAAAGAFLLCVMLAGMTGRPLTDRTYDVAPLRILPEFLLGMVAARACLEGRVNGSVAAALGALLLATGIGLDRPLLVSLAAPCVISALFVIDPKVPDWARSLGLISYSLYMVHALVEKVGFTLLEKALGQELVPAWGVLGLTAVAILAGAAMYALVEEPARRALTRPARSARRAG